MCDSLSLGKCKSTQNATLLHAIVMVVIKEKKMFVLIVLALGRWKKGGLLESGRTWGLDWATQQA